ncbi:MAG: chalcone isomerase family protein [Candidatus Binatia bacterium]
MRVSAVVIVLALLVGLAPAGPAAAGGIDGVSFPDQLETRGTPLELRGLGLMRWRELVKVCAAAFYRATGEARDRAVGDGARRLEITYLHALRASDLARSTTELLRRNVPKPTLEAIRPRIARLTAALRDVGPGDRFALTYIPEHGTDVALNGQVLDVIEGGDFADAVFAIWFGPRPLDRDLKAQLLGAA